MSAGKNLSVGLFVSAALVLFVVFAIWVTGQKGNEPTDTYAILIDKDVSGLMLGGPVFFMGVQVGEVTGLSIAPGPPHRIRVEISVLETTPVDIGTRATLAAQGITGVSVINLSSESELHSPLAKTDSDPLPIIPYQDSGFSAILSSAPELIDEMKVLLNNANQLFSEDNLLAVNLVLANIERLTSTLAAHEAQLAALPVSIDAALQDVRLAVREVDNLLRTNRPDIEAILTNLNSGSKNLASISEQLNDLMSSQDEALQSFTADGLGQVPDLISETRGAIRAMELLLEDLRENPSSAIYRPASAAIEVED